MKKTGTPGLRVKVGDDVKVIAGNDRGKTGKIIKSLPRLGKVIVEGVNLKTKHNKADNGGVAKVERPIDASNVALTSKTSKSTKKPAAKKTTSKKPAVKKSTTTKKAASDKSSKTTK